jgi:hypothetical protein
MARLMSVAFTEAAVRDRTKTVTRRKGWLFLKPGDRLTLCRKVMGRKKGEPLERVAEVEIVSVRRESLGHLTQPHRTPTQRPYFDEDSAPWHNPAYAADEMVREGFPGLRPTEFVRTYFVEAQGFGYHDDVTRIEWRYLDDERAAAR